MALSHEDASLRERFPALGRLGDVLRRREVPYVPQTTVTDCGAASLASVLAYHGRQVRLDELREATGAGRSGVSARAVLDVASLYELNGRGVRVELADLASLPPATILHWNLRHFVVLERADGREVTIVDPAFGRRILTYEDAGKAFTGIALIFEKGDLFEAFHDTDKPLRRFLLRAFRESNDWGRIVMASLVMQVFASALPLINGRLIDRVVPRGDHELLLVLVAAFMLAVSFQFLTQMVRGHLLLHLRTRFDVRITLGFLEHLLRLPYAFFQQRKTADLLIRINSIGAIREVVTSSLISAMLDGTLVVGYLALLLSISPKLACAALLVVLIQSSTYLLTRKKLRELAAANIAQQTESASYLTELLAGIETLKSIGSESRASQHWAGMYVDLLNNALYRGTIATWSDAVLGTIRTASPFLLLITGVVDVMNGQMTLGTMMTANAFAFGFVQPVSNLIGSFTALQFVRIQLARVNDVLIAKPEQAADPPRQLRLSPPLSGRIELRGVSFRYAASSPVVVKDVSLRIEPGQMVALVGASGSGKSTLASLLLGLYEPTEGDVQYDGLSLKDIDLRSLRRQLGVVVQKAYVFGTTVRANIALSDPDTPLDRVVAAAKLACIHDDVMAMGLGYDTPLIAGGGSISGGQRQRVALARALVSEPAVLLLDEATSALDSLTEQKVQRNLESLGCTRIIVAHRLSTVKAADAIVVMSEGRVVESGTHEELLALGGTYWQMVRAQDVAVAGPEAAGFDGSAATSPPTAFDRAFPVRLARKA